MCNNNISSCWNGRTTHGLRMDTNKNRDSCGCMQLILWKHYIGCPRSSTGLQLRTGGHIVLAPPKGFFMPDNDIWDFPKISENVCEAQFMKWPQRRNKEICPHMPCSGSWLTPLVWSIARCWASKWRDQIHVLEISLCLQTRDVEMKWEDKIC